MSIRSEIRAALVDGPKTTDELLPLVASVEGDRQRLQQHMGNLAGEQMVRRAGLSEDNKPIYQLDPKAWPAKGEEGEAVTVAAGRIEGPNLRKAAPPPKAAKPAKKAKAKPAAKKVAKARKSQRPPAKSQRKTAISRPAKPTANAIQVGGSHYQALAPQPWDVITSWGLSFLAGNVIKYVARAPAKGGIEDLQKARHYLDKLIETAAA